MYITL
jgi:hypothetical protein